MGPIYFIGVSHCSASYIKLMSFCWKGASKFRFILFVDQGHFKEEANRARGTVPTEYLLATAKVHRVQYGYLRITSAFCGSSTSTVFIRLWLHVHTGTVCSQIPCRRSWDHSTQFFFGALSELMPQVSCSCMRKTWKERLTAHNSTTSAVIQTGVKRWSESWAWHQPSRLTGGSAF